MSIDEQSRGVPAWFSTDYTLSHENPASLILIECGLRKLHVQICKYSPDILDLLSGIAGGLSSWTCGHAVIRLDAENGRHYRIRGSINKKDDFSEFWIEDSETGHSVTHPVRAQGLN
jgi:hypothetical protein